MWSFFLSVNSFFPQHKKNKDLLANVCNIWITFKTCNNSKKYLPVGVRYKWHALYISISICTRYRYGFEEHISLIKFLPLILTLVMVYLVVSGDGFLSTEMDDKLSITLALGKLAVVIGWNGVFSISVGSLVTTTGNPSLKVTADVDADLGVELE